MINKTRINRCRDVTTMSCERCGPIKQAQRAAKSSQQQLVRTLFVLDRNESQEFLYRLGQVRLEKVYLSNKTSKILRGQVILLYKTSLR